MDSDVFWFAGGLFLVLLLSAVAGLAIRSFGISWSSVSRTRAGMLASFAVAAGLTAPVLFFAVDPSDRWAYILMSIGVFVFLGTLVFGAATYVGKHAEQNPDAKMAPWPVGVGAVLLLAWMSYRLFFS